ncbi:type II CRISPR-associated endonuclease Cas1 [Gemella morbillorum]|uniref:type II CRISPR-associated endonuclease Cas1 n=1 Tax=Gemella morbillorum TaxID=29391 RepID=UPI001CB0B0C3|nr:type II CRISPR-associated endonuclease Cas1 [Gemella morbillorum]MBF1212974.1 type II CRISPR-associated endonuclease Cas1 [Gemella morbillorum]
MTWRTVVIRERAKLDYSLNFMTVRQETGVRKISLGEIYMVIVENTAVSLTAVLLNELVKNKIKVVFCDEKRNPSSELIQYYGSHDTSLKYKNQLEWSKENKEKIWTRIVYEKIFNQMQFLKKLNKEEYRLLEQYLSELEWNDSSNREGFAAKVYFNALYGMDFSRNKECFINAALDYGYSIILSAFNREIVASGYFTQLGLCHRNPFNKFNLSSDFMEPFRILVDEEVYNLEGTEFTKDHKNKLINILNKTVIIDDKNQTVANAIKIYCRSLFSALAENDLEYVKMYRYEL